jgi:hypothetical protein
MFIAYLLPENISTEHCVYNERNPSIIKKMYCHAPNALYVISVIFHSTGV